MADSGGRIPPDIKGHGGSEGGGTRNTEAKEVTGGDNIQSPNTAPSGGGSVPKYSQQADENYFSRVAESDAANRSGDPTIHAVDDPNKQRTKNKNEGGPADTQQKRDTPNLLTPKKGGGQFVGQTKETFEKKGSGSATEQKEVVHNVATCLNKKPTDNETKSDVLKDDSEAESDASKQGFDRLEPDKTLSHHYKTRSREECHENGQNLHGQQSSLKPLTKHDKEKVLGGDGEQVPEGTDLSGSFLIVDHGDCKDVHNPGMDSAREMSHSRKVVSDVSKSLLSSMNKNKEGNEEIVKEHPECSDSTSRHKSQFMKQHGQKTIGSSEATIEKLEDDTEQDGKKKEKDDIENEGENKDVQAPENDTCHSQNPSKKAEVEQDATHDGSAEMTVCVKTQTGKKMKIDARLTDTAENIKVKIEDKEGIAPNHQRLIKEGEEIFGDQRTLLEYDFDKETTIHLVVKQKKDVDSPAADSAKGMSGHSTEILSVSETEKENGNVVESEKTACSDTALEPTSEFIHSQKMAAAAASAQRLNDDIEHKNDKNKDKDERKCIEKQMQDPRDDASPKNPLKTVEAERDTTHDVSAGDDNPEMFRNNFSEGEEQTEEQSRGEESDYLPESGSPLSKSSSFEKIPEGDQEETTSDTTHVSVEFQMCSMTHLTDDGRKEEKCNSDSQTPEGKAKQTDDAIVNVKEEPNTQSVKDNEPTKYDPTIECLPSPEYKIELVGKVYILRSKSCKAVRVPQIAENSNVYIDGSYILIDGNVEYYIHTESGKIVLSKIEDAKTGDDSKENQNGVAKENQNGVAIARNDNSGKEYGMKKDRATKVRATIPMGETLIKVQNEEKSKTKTCSPADTYVDDNGDISEKEGNLNCQADKLAVQTDASGAKNKAKKVEAVPVVSPRCPQTNKSSAAASPPVAAPRKRARGRTDERMSIPVRVYIGGDSTRSEAVCSSRTDYLKWMYAIKNNDAGRQFSSENIKIENNEVVLTLKENPKDDEVIKDTLKTYVNNMKGFFVASFEGNGNEEEIFHAIDQSDMVKGHNVYTYFERSSQKIYIVCFVKFLQDVDKEFREALSELNTNLKRQFSVELKCQDLCEMSFDHCNIQEKITSKLHGVCFDYTLDYNRRCCICRFQGNSLVELGKAHDIVQQDLEKYTYNCCSFLEIKNIQKIGAEHVNDYLNMEIAHLCETFVDTDMHFKVNMEKNQVIIAGYKQGEVDSLINKTKSCVSCKEFKIPKLNKTEEESLLEKISGFSGRIFVTFKELKCCCTGSSDAIKMFEEHIRKLASDKNKTDDASCEVQQEQISRTVHIKEFDTFDFIGKNVDFKKMKFGSDATVEIKQSTNKFGFLIKGSEESVISLENKIKTIESQVHEKEMSVKVFHSEMEHYKASVSKLQTDCDVLIKTLQEKALPEPRFQNRSSCQSRQWTFTGGHTLQISHDHAKNQWQDLLVEMDHFCLSDKDISSEPHLKAVGNRKVMKLLVPKHSSAGKLKTTFQESAKRVLEEACHCQCTHVCIPIDELGGWHLDKFVKQIFHVVIKHFEKMSCHLPLVVQLCLPEYKNYKICCATAESSMPETAPEISDDSEVCSSHFMDDRYGITVEIVNGKLDDTKADVIVNTTAPDLKLQNGAVSKSIYNSAGKEIQEECDKKYHNGIEEGGEIAITKGYQLKCKHVFHGALQGYDEKDDKRSIQNIEKFIIRCLQKANFLGHKSIAFPVIGTGKLEYPEERIADAMFNAVKSFEEEFVGSMTVQLVKVVIFKSPDVVRLFEKKKEIHEKGKSDKRMKKKVEHFTSRTVDCSTVTVNAMMGTSLAACEMAEALIVFWDTKKIDSKPSWKKGSKLLKDMGKTAAAEFSAKCNTTKAFSTHGGNLSNRPVIHVPVKMSQVDLKKSFEEGLCLADSEMIYSAAVYLDAKECFLPASEEIIAKAFVETVQKMAADFKNLTRVALVISDTANIAKYFEVFSEVASEIEDAEDVLASTGIEYLIKMIGYKPAIEKAELKLSGYYSKVFEAAASTVVPVAEAPITEPELQSMDRTCSLKGEQETGGDEKEKILMRNFPGYVKISNIPPNYTYDGLSGELMRATLPVPFQTLIFLDGVSEALLICKTSEDVKKLAQFNGKTTLKFSSAEKQSLKNLSLNLENGDLERLRHGDNYRKFQDSLEKLHIKFDVRSGSKVEVRTCFQLECLDKLLKMFRPIHPQSADDRFVMTPGEDDFEHIVKATVTIEGTTDKIWKIMQVEKKEKVEEFEKTVGTFSHSQDVLTLKRTDQKANDDKFDDFVSVFKSFVDRMKQKEFQEIPVDDEFLKHIPAWKEEIENNLKKHCCTFIPLENKVIAYFDSYEGVKQIEHQFLVKQGRRKQTARKRKVAGTTEIEPDNKTCSEIKKADFEWKRDAKNIQAYKTSEEIQVYVYEASIVNLPVDCIVNAANENLQHGGGVALAIAKGAGQTLTDEGNKYLRSNHRIPVGKVVSTTAGNLPYHCVIHAVGPRWSDYAPYSYDDVRRCEQDLYNAIYNSFLEADRKGLQTIALPAISSAIFAVPINLCVNQYVSATIGFSRDQNTKTNIKEVHFIDIKADIVKCIQKEFETVLSCGEPSSYQREKHIHLVTGQRHLFQKPDKETSWKKFDRSKRNDSSGNRAHSSSVFESGKKHIYQLGGTEEQKLFVYACNILEVEDSAIVVSVDENLVPGFIGQAVSRLINEQLLKRYKLTLKNKVPAGTRTGFVAVTDGYGSPFTHIIHVVFPYRERDQPDTERRRKILIKAFQNILFGAKQHGVRKVATPIFGIDDSNKDDVDFGINAFLDAYQNFLSQMKQTGNSEFEVHLVFRNTKLIDRVISTFDAHEKKHQNTQQKITAVKGKTDPDSECQHEKMDSGEGDGEDCVICMDEMKDPRVLQCGHKFCDSCIERHFEIKKTCPTCGAVCGIIKGDQPEGTMYVNWNSHQHCAGYYSCGQISITYTFPSGKQGPNHPNPGTSYKGITRTAYLPDMHEGRKILEMLRVAFERKLTFTIGRSRTTGQEGVITWNDIHHKTDPRPNTQFGYPDPTYLTRVKEELAAKGVTEKDIPKLYTS